jgi:hypothetical protein
MRSKWISGFIANCLPSECLLVKFRDALKLLPSSPIVRHYFCGSVTIPADGSYIQLCLADFYARKYTTSLVHAVLSSSTACNILFHLFECAVWCTESFTLWMYLKREPEIALKCRTVTSKFSKAETTRFKVTVPKERQSTSVISSVFRRQNFSKYVLIYLFYSFVYLFYLLILSFFYLFYLFILSLIYFIYSFFRSFI